MKNADINRTPQLPLDENERARRTELLEETAKMLTARGGGIDRRCADLLEAFLYGSLDLDELRHEILRPYLH